LYPYIEDPDMAAVRAFDYLTHIASELGIATGPSGNAEG
jgi:hypothetical protein